MASHTYRCILGEEQRQLLVAALKNFDVAGFRPTPDTDPFWEEDLKYLLPCLEDLPEDDKSVAAEGLTHGLCF